MEQGSHNQNPCVGFQQQPHFAQSFFAAAHHHDYAVLKIKEYGKIAHDKSSTIGHEFNCKAVQVLGVDNLARQPRGWRQHRNLVQHGFFVVIGGVQLVGPLGMNLDMACRTGAGTAAQPTHLKAVLPDDFHHPPALYSLQNVAYIVGVYHLNHAHNLLLFAYPDVYAVHLFFWKTGDFI